MTTGGIIFMALGWGMALVLLGYCLYKIFRTGNTLGDS
jgi:hypothetical protein